MAGRAGPRRQRRTWLSADLEVGEVLTLELDFYRQRREMYIVGKVDESL
jgi:hypothetical protein